MRCLVFGGVGMLGQAVVREARRRGWPALGASQEQADLRDPAAMRRLAEAFRPQLVINCAAHTLVDDCEEQRELALEVNGRAVARVGEVATEVGARLVQISSDYVFDGTAQQPYGEEATPAPLSVYGESKRLGEDEALQFDQALVVRASWLFGPGGANFVRTILNLIDRGRTELDVVDDQLGAPTYTPYLARALCDLAALGAAGVVHYRNRESASWHRFATEIARLAAPGVTVRPVATSAFPRPARRPAYSVLDVRRFESLVGRPVESWSAGLSRYLESLRGAEVP